MTGLRLKPAPLTAERFAPFGDVIEASTARAEAMNDARFERFNDLAGVDVDSADGGRVSVSIARCKTATRLPYHFDTIERHPLGSQAFIPLLPFAFVVVVARPGETAEATDLHAFVTNGRQGVNYSKGTWHMPLIAMDEHQEFLVIDRAPGDGDCEELVLDQSVILEAP